MPTKRKSVRRTSRGTRNRNKQHPKHFAKVYWPYLPVIAVVLAGMLFGGVNPRSKDAQPATLAYATEMSINSLLSHTNQQRANNGLPALAIDSVLNSSAQSKSNDMVTRDYWSHETPEGQDPWIFFTNAGYSYQKAGENLAYGHATSADAVTDWMNSPSHRANILDSTYTEVGFGIKNSANFVGSGEATVVVAHYAKPAGAAPTPSPASEPETLAQTQSQAPVAQAQQPGEEVVVEPEPEPKPLPGSGINQPITSDNPIPDDVPSKRVSRLDKLTNGDLPWAPIVLAVITYALVAVWLLKHALLVKRYFRKGEKFVAHHPLFDLFVVSVVALAIYLSQSSGVIL